MTVEIQEPPKPERRPNDFTDDIFATICERMTEGEGLREICRDPEMPNRQTFLRWVERDTGRQTQYQQAREALMDWYAEEILTIAWDSSKDTVPAIDNKPARCDHEWVARSRLKVDTLKFLMSKLHPKRYGDKLPETEEGKIAEAKRLEISWEKPVTQINRIILTPLRDADDVLLDTEAKLRKRIIQLEEQLGLREGEPQPPKLLTYDPGPLPSRIDPEVLSRFLRMIKDTVPSADQRPPEEVLDEVLSECENALAAKYGNAISV